MTFLSFSGETDGIIRTFDLFMAYDPGYFVVEVLARDLAGHSDVALVGIYILRDDQRVKIVINEIPERVRLFQEEFINLLSNITGAIVNTDDVQVYVCCAVIVNIVRNKITNLSVQSNIQYFSCLGHANELIQIFLSHSFMWIRREE